MFIDICDRYESLKLLRRTESQQVADDLLLDRIVNVPELAASHKPPQRGVEEVIIRAKDWRAFEVTDSAGECAMYVEWPREKVTQGRIEGLWRWLDREDPQPQLRVVT